MHVKTASDELNFTQNSQQRTVRCTTGKLHELFANYVHWPCSGGRGHCSAGRSALKTAANHIERVSDQPAGRNAVSALESSVESDLYLHGT
jgi:hypothetical protein